MIHAIQPEHLSLIELLNTRLFTIPDYQRSYSWSTREREDLFNDIERVAKEGDGASHYMATVVCLRRREVQQGTNILMELDIIDGQQRLTTLILLLNTIRNALDRKKRRQKRESDQLGDMLVKPDGENLLLLQTNHDSSHYFSTYLRKGVAPSHKEAKTKADKNLLLAIHECKEFVASWKEGKGKLLDLVALVKNQLSFVLHEISDEKTVYTVFELLNSRGIPVASLDRLKSILMGLAFTFDGDVVRERLINELHTIWRDIYSAIGLRQGLDAETLRFAATLYSPARRSRLLSEEKAVDALRQRAETGRAEDVRDVADWVLRVTKASDVVRSNARNSAVWNVAPARLLAVALHARDTFSDQERNRLIAIWEKISFRIYGLHRKDTRFAVGDYCKLAWDVVNKPKTRAEIIHRRIRRIGDDYDIEDGLQNLRDGFPNPRRRGTGPDCYNGWTDELRYFMFRYEEHLAKERGETIDNSRWDLVWSVRADMSIEHILPQSEAPDDVKHRLGNLMLLPQRRNSKLGNKQPEEKAASYRRAGFFHADEVADMLDGSRRWGGKECKRREEALLDWARKEWGDEEW